MPVHPLWKANKTRIIDYNTPFVHRRRCSAPTVSFEHTNQATHTHTPRVLQSSEYKSTDGLCLKRCRSRPPLVSQQFFNRFHYGLVKCLTVSQSVIYTVSTCVVLLVAVRPSG